MVNNLRIELSQKNRKRQHSRLVASGMQPQAWPGSILRPMALAYRSLK
jgi:hypothetical protein